MEILLATSNEHKLTEVRAILEPTGITIRSLSDFPEAAALPEPVEDAPTFAGNARIKATYYAAATNRICLADDSGLVVDALNGDPGVFSARYAADELGGVGGGVGREAGGKKLDRATRDNANNDKLLRELAKLALPLEKRTARFVCAMCLVDGSASGNVIAETEGRFEGLITDQPRGNNGFGYDPLLYLPDVDKTSAELSSPDKNARSHRAAALCALVKEITALGITSA